MIRRIDSSQMESADCFRVYAVADRSALESLLVESECAAFSCIAVNELIAIVDSLPIETNQTSVAASHLTAFGNQIVELHRVADIIPFRFASAVTLHALSAHLKTRYAFYKVNLQLVAGCTEVNARWVIAEDAPINNSAACEKPSGGSGREYLRSKHRASMTYRKLENDLKILATDIGSKISVSCVEIRTTRRSLDDIANKPYISDQTATLVSGPLSNQQFTIAGLELLLRREQAQQYLQSLAQTRFRNVLPTITSGPWPPYSFIADFNAAFVTAPDQALATAESVQTCAISARAGAAS